VDGRGGCGCGGGSGGRGRGRHVTAQVGGADHVTGRAVRQVRRGGRRRRRRAVHVIAAGVLERRLVGRPVLQAALEQRHERGGGRTGRGRRHVGRDQLAGLLLLLLLLLVQRFLHGRRRLLVIISRSASAGTSVGHARKLGTGHQVVYGDVRQYAGLVVLRRTVRVFVRRPVVAHAAQPLVGTVHGRVVAAGRHRGVGPERRAAHEHFELVELIVDERVLLLELGQSRVRGRRHQVFVLVVHVVVGRGRVVVVLGHPVVGRDRLIVVAGYAVDVDALRDRVERHQRLEVGEIRGRLGVGLIDAVRLLMVMAVVVMTAV